MKKAKFALAKFFKSLKPKRTRLFAVLVILFLIFGIGFGLSAYASVGDFFAQLFALLFYGIAYVLGWLTMLVFSLVITISGFQDFVSNEGVITGWTVIRDVCNMFFVVILLIIAFATILRVEKYSVTTLLPKVIIAAVAINFSKMICGLIIDFGQVVMLTFVNGFKASAGANLINGLRMNSWMTIDPASKTAQSEIDWWDLALAMAFVCVLFFFTLIVSIIMVIILAMRIVFLWILIILSPFAFVGSLLPFTQSLASQWWAKFGNWVAIGPILAFFLWLSLLMMQGGTLSPDIEQMGQEAERRSQITDAPLQSGNLSAGSSIPNTAQFAVGVALLYGAVTLTKQMGGAVGGFVGGKVMGAARGVGGAAAGAAYRVTGARAVAERYRAARGALKAKREERYKEFGARAARGYERVAAPVREGLAQVVKTPARVMALPLRAPKIVKGLQERMERNLDKGKGGLETYARAFAAIPAEILGTRQIASAFRKPMTRAKGAQYEAAKGKVGTQLKELKAAKYDPEKSREAMSKAGTIEERVAHLIHASKAGKLKQEDVPAGERILAKVKGTGLEDVVKEELQEKFAHSLHDLETFEGRQGLMGDHDKGKFDFAKLDPNAFKDANVIQTMVEKFGDNADKMFKRVFDKGGKYSENLVKGLQAAEGIKPAMSTRLATLKKQDLSALPDDQKNRIQGEIDSLERFDQSNLKGIQAKVTGRPFETFGATPDLGKFVRKMNVKDLEKMKIDTNTNRFMGASDAQHKIAVENISTARITTMMEKGNDDFARTVVRSKVDLAGQAGAKGDKAKEELRNLSNNQVFMNKLDDKKLVNQIENIVKKAPPSKPSGPKVPTPRTSTPRVSTPRTTPPPPTTPPTSTT